MAVFSPKIIMVTIPCQSPDTPILHLSRSDALLLVDVQNDFLPGGSLAVPSGNKIIPALNRYIEAFSKASLPIYATRDWHPADHCSFMAQGGIWPPHCIAGSPGAAFAPALKLPADATIISKAANREMDAYSGFEGTDLEQRLRLAGVSRLFTGGLATDYCVLNTVKDGLSKGFDVLLLLDGIRAVNLKPDDGQRAIDEMTTLGACPIRYETIAA